MSPRWTYPLCAAALTLTACDPHPCDPEIEEVCYTISAPSRQTVPLYAWYHPGRGDNFATTDQRWAGRDGDEQDGYRFVRVEGRVFAPSGSQPAGTVPLFSWYHPEREDNLLTSDPRWAGEPGALRDGYRLYRLEGYIYADPVAETLPLTSWWSAERADNFATTDARWTGEIGARRGPDYAHHRIEGHLLPPETPLPSESAALGNGRVAPPARLPLLVIQTDWPDLHTTRDESWLRERVFGERPAPADGTIPLYEWFSPGRGDHFTTSDPDWAGHPPARRSASYVHQGILGHAFAPEAPAPAGTVPLYFRYNDDSTNHRTTTDPAWGEGRVLDGWGDPALMGFLFDPSRARPAGTTPLWSWYDAERRDHHLASDPYWDPAGGRTRGGYTFQRLEGFAPAEDLATVPLHHWWSAVRQDNMVSSAGIWRAEPQSRRAPDYRAVHVAGRLFSPDRPQPAGTVPLHSWWNAERGDNFATTAPEWRGPGAGDGVYGHVRLEGYVFDPDRPRPPGTVPLRSFWSDERGDNLLTSAPMFVGEEDIAPDYRFYRLEGYVYPDRAPEPWNLVEFFAELSYGHLTLEPSLARVRLTTSFFDTPDFDREVLRRAAEQVDFSAFDQDGDGIVGRDELAILVLEAPHSGSGQTRSGVSGMRLSGIRLANDYAVAFADEASTINLQAHELFHALGRGIDLYAPVCASTRATLMGCTGADAPAPFRLDPWHAMRAGWTTPRVRSAANAGAVELIAGDPRPVFLYDPELGADGGFFIEYRDGRVDGHDAGTLAPGVAVWQVRTQPDVPMREWYRTNGGGLSGFTWPPPYAALDQDPITAWVNYLVGADGPGVGPYFTPDHAVVSLNRGDGRDTGLRLQVTEMERGRAVVSWIREGTDTAPRIDRVLDSSPLRIDGNFPGALDAVEVILTGAPGARPLRIVSRSSIRLEAELPPGLDPGRYTLAVRGADGATSSPVALQIHQL